MRGIVDERVRGCFPKPAGGRQRGVHQAAQSLLRRFGGTGVRPPNRLGQDPLEGSRPQAASLLPSAHAPVRGLQGVGGYTAGRIRGRAVTSILALVRQPEDGAPPARRPCAWDPRRTLPHVRGASSERRLLLGDERSRIPYDLRGTVRVGERPQRSGALRVSRRLWSAADPYPYPRRCEGCCQLDAHALLVRAQRL